MPPSFIPPKEFRNLCIHHETKTISTIMAEHVDNEDETNLFVLPDAQRDPTKGWSERQRQEYIESLRCNLTSDQNWLINVVSATDTYELLDAGHRLETVKMFDRSELPTLDGRYLKDMSKKEISYWKHKIGIKLCFYHDLTAEHKQVLFNRRNQGLSMCDGEQLNSRLFTSSFMKYLKHEVLPRYETSLSRVASNANEREKELFTLFRLVNRILNPGTTAKSNKDLVEKALPECEKIMQSPEWRTKKKNEVACLLDSLFHAFDGRLEYVSEDVKKRSAEGKKDLKDKSLYSITELYTVLDWFITDFESLSQFVAMDTTAQKLVFKSAINEFLLIGWKGLKVDDKTEWCDRWSHGAECGRNVDHSIKKTGAFYEWLDLNFSRMVQNRKSATPKKRSFFRL
jgi:hypothetical protein